MSKPAAPARASSQTHAARRKDRRNAEKLGAAGLLAANSVDSLADLIEYMPQVIERHPSFEGFCAICMATLQQELETTSDSNPESARNAIFSIINRATENYDALAEEKKYLSKTYQRVIGAMIAELFNDQRFDIARVEENKDMFLQNPRALKRFFDMEISQVEPSLPAASLQAKLGTHATAVEDKSAAPSLSASPFDKEEGGFKTQRLQGEAQSKGEKHS